MATIEIYDLIDPVRAPGVDWQINVDLPELFALLLPQSLEATWTISRVFGEWLVLCDTPENGRLMDGLASANSQVSGSEMQRLSQSIRQSVWGGICGIPP